MTDMIGMFILNIEGQVGVSHDLTLQSDPMSVCCWNKIYKFISQIKVGDSTKTCDSDSGHCKGCD